VAAKRAAPAASFGELSGRLQDLFAKTVKPGPYPVTDTILIRPPTKGEWERLDALQDEQRAARFALGALLPFIGTENGPTQADLDGLTKTATDADTAYDALFFGDHLDSVKSLSAGWERADWLAFTNDIKSHFLGAGPATGACPHCGTILDEEQAGKDSAPST
jgi:hypothetical protein